MHARQNDCMAFHFKTLRVILLMLERLHRANCEPINPFFGPFYYFLILLMHQLKSSFQIMFQIFHIYEYLDSLFGFEY